MTRKTFYFICICGVALFSAGCSKDIDTWEINQAEEFCKDHGGVDKYTAWWLLAEDDFTCADGFKADLTTTTKSSE